MSKVNSWLAAQEQIKTAQHTSTNMMVVAKGQTTSNGHLRL
jgi:hypothetical protein